MGATRECEKVQAREAPRKVIFSAAEPQPNAQHGLTAENAKIAKDE
jgi:hypothetical protein